MHEHQELERHKMDLEMTAAHTYQARQRGQFWDALGWLVTGIGLLLLAVAVPVIWAVWTAVF